MRTTFLGGVSALALLLASAGTGLAQESNTANNNEDTAVAQDGGVSVDVGEALLQFATDVVAAEENAADDGASVGDNGAAIGAFTFGNDAVAGSSTQTNVYAENNDAVAVDDSSAVDDGALVIGNGVGFGEDADRNATAVGEGSLALATGGGDIADEGSAFQYGDNNESVTASQNSAAADRGVAITTGGAEAVDEGSSLVYGNGNTTSSADEFSAVSGDGGTSITIRAPSASGVFGANNAVSTADLDQQLTDIAVTVEPFAGEENDEGEENNTSRLETGRIYGNSFTDVSGVNEFFANTGLGNQGHSASIAARASFN